MQQSDLIIGITGASGAIYGVRALEILRDIAQVKTHLIVSQAGLLTLKQETGHSLDSVRELADTCYASKDIAAPVSSGSFKTMGMLIAPCSMRSLAEIASGVSGSLMSRAADVVLKERRKLVLLTRETPLHAIHLENMQRVTQAGGIIAPPVPAFYQNPQTLDDVVNHTVGRALDLFDIESQQVKRWAGMSAK